METRKGSIHFSTIDPRREETNEERTTSVKSTFVPPHWQRWKGGERWKRTGTRRATMKKKTMTKKRKEG